MYCQTGEVSSSPVRIAPVSFALFRAWPPLKASPVVGVVSPVRSRGERVVRDLG